MVPRELETISYSWIDLNGPSMSFIGICHYLQLMSLSCTVCKILPFVYEIKGLYEPHVRYMLSPVRLSVCRLSVCNVRAHYSAGWNFRQYFYAIWYLGHPLTYTENFMEIVPGNSYVGGGVNARGVAKYSDFGAFGGPILETVQDRR